MPQTKVLLIDMDAIVADLASEWYRRWNQRQISNAIMAGKEPPKPLTVEDVNMWDVGKAINDGGIYAVLNEPGLYKSLRVFPGSQRVVSELNKLKHPDGTKAFNVTFLTAAVSAPHILTDKAEWMRSNFGFISPRQMIYAYQKELVRGDYLIDDGPKNLAKWKAAWPEGKTITITYPYNAEQPVDFRAGHYSNMEDVWWAIYNYLRAEVGLPLKPATSYRLRSLSDLGI